jgi:hypothetical protein
LTPGNSAVVRRCHAMTMATPAAVEAEIHVIMQDRIEAVHAKDAARLVAG